MQGELLWDALDIVWEIAKLIKYSPKRSHLFSEKLAQADNSEINIKPLCPTWWTAQMRVVDAVLEGFFNIDGDHGWSEQNHKRRIWVKGGLSSLETFATLFGLKLRHFFFGAAEMSKVLQVKHISPGCCEGCQSCTTFYRHQQDNAAFSDFCNIVHMSQDPTTEPPQLPRYGKAPFEARLPSATSIPYTQRTLPWAIRTSKLVTYRIQV